MIVPGAELKIYIATRPVDFRCGHDGLAAKVQQAKRLPTCEGSVRCCGCRAGAPNAGVAARPWSASRWRTRSARMPLR
ncbi:IS66 family insertion sequence element accessory protein TnpB [Bradyrhizobium vignae]|uniref:IS66 family insertion sequence element accessory protein TnpB n=1 Tax=Bradyrhizobium vignae TaxID=1549949 RepID=UPI003D319538